LSEHRLVALVYPTLRRKPARVGDGQGGSTCQLSSHSGLPALALPAGFSDDGVPVGIDLLGAAFSEQELLSLGYAIEKTVKLRQPPFSTPALVGGKAPSVQRQTVSWGSGATQGSNDGHGVGTAELEYDPLNARLAYRFAFEPRADILAIWLHRIDKEAPGAALRPLFDARLAALSGMTILSFQERRDLVEGNLGIRVYGPRGPIGGVVAVRLKP